MQCIPRGSVFGSWGFIAYTDDLIAVPEKHNVHSHMYADDTQLYDYDSSSLVNAESVQDRLTSCVSEVAKWCAPRRLQLNDDKTEMIWCGSRSNLAKLQRINLSLQHTAQQRRPGSGRLYRLRADGERTRRQNHCRLLLPHSSSAPGSSSDRPGRFNKGRECSHDHSHSLDGAAAFS